MYIYCQTPSKITSKIKIIPLLFVISGFFYIFATQLYTRITI